MNPIKTGAIAGFLLVSLLAVQPFLLPILLKSSLVSPGTFVDYYSTVIIGLTGIFSTILYWAVYSLGRSMRAALLSILGLYFVIYSAFVAVVELAIQVIWVLFLKLPPFLLLFTRNQPYFQILFNVIPTAVLGVYVLRIGKVIKYSRVTGIFVIIASVSLAILQGIILKLQHIPNIGFGLGLIGLPFLLPSWIALALLATFLLSASKAFQ